jgi:hypothetical protein
MSTIAVRWPSIPRTVSCTSAAAGARAKEGVVALLLAATVTSMASVPVAAEAEGGGGRALICPRDTIELFLSSLLPPEVDPEAGASSLTAPEYNLGIT